MEPLNEPKKEGEDRTKLIINYLPQTMTEKELKTMFITLGPLKSTKIMKDWKTGYSFGFGFVEYEKPEDAARAVTALNGLQIMDKKMKVSYSREPGEDIKNTNLYITNLPRNLSIEEVEALFSIYGRIVQSNLLKDKHTGMSRGVAFIRYDKKSEADAAILSLNGTIPPGGTETVSVKIAQEHGKKKAALYMGWQGMQPPELEEPQDMQSRIWQRGFPPSSRGNFRAGMGRGRFPRASGGPMRFNGGGGYRYNPMGPDYSNMYDWN